MGSTASWNRNQARQVIVHVIPTGVYEYHHRFCWSPCEKKKWFVWRIKFGRPYRSYLCTEEDRRQRSKLQGEPFEILKLSRASTKTFLSRFWYVFYQRVDIDTRLWTLLSSWRRSTWFWSFLSRTVLHSSWAVFLLQTPSLKRRWPLRFSLFPPCVNLLQEGRGKMSSASNKAEHFLKSPLVAWVSLWSVQDL